MGYCPIHHYPLSWITTSQKSFNGSANNSHRYQNLYRSPRHIRRSGAHAHRSSPSEFVLTSPHNPSLQKSWMAIMPEQYYASLPALSLRRLGYSCIQESRKETSLS